MRSAVRRSGGSLRRPRGVQRSLVPLFEATANGQADHIISASGPLEKILTSKRPDERDVIVFRELGQYSLQFFGFRRQDQDINHGRTFHSQIARDEAMRLALE